MTARADDAIRRGARRAVLARLLALYPSAPVLPETIDALLDVLDDVDPRELQAAAKRWARRSRFWPSAAELLEEIASARIGAPDVEVALVQIRAALDGPCFDEAALHPLAVEAARTIGVEPLRDRWSYLVGALRETYRGLAQAVKRSATSAEPGAGLPPGLAAIADGTAAPAHVRIPPMPELPAGDVGQYVLIAGEWHYRPRPRDRQESPLRLVSGAPAAPHEQPSPEALERRRAEVVAFLEGGETRA
jgi:hypothetical protein